MQVYQGIKKAFTITTANNVKNAKIILLSKLWNLTEKHKNVDNRLHIFIIYIFDGSLNSLSEL